MDVALYINGGSQGTKIAEWIAVPTLTSWSWTDWLALNPGDTLRVGATVGNRLVVAGFGALLEGEPA